MSTTLSQNNPFVTKSVEIIKWDECDWDGTYVDQICDSTLLQMIKRWEHHVNALVHRVIGINDWRWNPFISNKPGHGTG